MPYKDIEKFWQENWLTIILTLMVIAIIYINYKVNDLNYRLQQTIMYNPSNTNNNLSTASFNVGVGGGSCNTW
jgi:hypothetical protein